MDTDKRWKTITSGGKQHHRPIHLHRHLDKLASSPSARSKSKTAKFSAIRDGVTMLVYTAEPDSPAAQALDFLASWATAQHPVEVDESSPR